jgi:hypothetical protein
MPWNIDSQHNPIHRFESAADPSGLAAPFERESATLH